MTIEARTHAYREASVPTSGSDACSGGPSRQNHDLRGESIYAEHAESIH